MKFALFLFATASAFIVDDDMTPWFEGEMFGQVDAEALDFGEAFDDTANFLFQIGSEERNGLGQILLQTKATSDHFIANMHPETRAAFDGMYAQTRESSFNWLG